MARVSGIGGFFFRARNPEGLARWYKRHLGIDDFTQSVWKQETGPTVFAPFPEGTDYFGSYAKQWMINFRVVDLDKLITELKAEGIEAETRPEWNSAAGRFARIHDPEGNPVELWEPPTMKR